MAIIIFLAALAGVHGIVKLARWARVNAADTAIQDDLLSWPPMAIYAWVFIAYAIGQRSARRRADTRGGQPDAHQLQLERTLVRNARLRSLSTSGQSRP